MVILRTGLIFSYSWSCIRKGLHAAWEARLFFFMLRWWPGGNHQRRQGDIPQTHKHTDIAGTRLTTQTHAKNIMLVFKMREIYEKVN